MFRETYPELKANESFLKMQDTLEGSENRISVERKRYNDAVRELNTYIKSFMAVSLLHAPVLLRRDILR